MHYLLIITVNPHLVATKPTNKHPGHGTVCHTKGSFCIEEYTNYQATYNKEMFTVTHCEYMFDT